MNTWNEINPGHIHQRHLADASGRASSNVADFPSCFTASTCATAWAAAITCCSRDLLVNEIELNAKAHHLDAMVLIGTCDKVSPPC